MGATPLSTAPAPKSPPPPLSAEASAAPSAIGPLRARFGVYREDLPGRSCILAVPAGGVLRPGSLPVTPLYARRSNGGGACVGVGPRVLFTTDIPMGGSWAIQRS